MFELVVNLISASPYLTKHTQENPPNTSSHGMSIVFSHTRVMLMQNDFPQAGFNRKEMEVLDLFKNPTQPERAPILTEFQTQRLLNVSFSVCFFFTQLQRSFMDSPTFFLAHIHTNTCKDI